MRVLIVLAVLLMSVSQLTSQLYLPVLPDIARDLGLSSSATQGIFVLYFMSLGLSQLIIGPLRDKFGDRSVFVAGQALLVFGTFLCSFADSLSMFVAGRILQGVGSASPVLISRTLLARHVTGANLKSAMASVAVAASITAIASPLIAGYLARSIGWQGLSLVMLGYFSLVLYLGFAAIPDISTSHSVSVHPSALISLYRRLLNDSNLLFLGCFKWAPTYLYLTIQLYLPFFLQDAYGYDTQQIGIAMMWPMTGLLVGAMLAKYLQKTMSYLHILKFLWPVFPFAALWFEFVTIHVIAVLIGYGLIMLVFGAYFPSYLHMIGLLQPEKAGSANALLNCIELLFFTTLAWLTNAILLDSQHVLPLIVVFCSALLWLSWNKLSMNLKLCEQ